MSSFNAFFTEKGWSCLECSQESERRGRHGELGLWRWRLPGSQRKETWKMKRGGQMPLGSQGKLLCIYFWVFLPCGTRDLSSQPGIKPTPPAVEEQSLNHWTTREVQGKVFWLFIEGWNFNSLNWIELQASWELHTHFAPLFHWLSSCQCILKLRGSFKKNLRPRPRPRHQHFLKFPFWLRWEANVEGHRPAQNPA